MPDREDERHRNLQRGHTRTCSCADCVRKRAGLPPVPPSAEEVEKSSAELRERTPARATAHAETSKDASEILQTSVRPAVRPKELVEREREERMHKERDAGTRPPLRENEPRTPGQEPGQTVRETPNYQRP